MTIEKTAMWIQGETGWRGFFRGACIYFILKAPFSAAKVWGESNGSDGASALFYLIGILTTLFFCVCCHRAAKIKNFSAMWCLSPVFFSVVLLPLFCCLKSEVVRVGKS